MSDTYELSNIGWDYLEMHFSAEASMFYFCDNELKV